MMNALYMHGVGEILLAADPWHNGSEFMLSQPLESHPGEVFSPMVDPGSESHLKSVSLKHPHVSSFTNHNQYSKVGATDTVFSKVLQVHSARYGWLH